MCGITGIYRRSAGADPRAEQLEHSLRKIAHRGPDHQDQLRDEQVALGHARLSVIEPGVAGHQPMWDRSGRFAIVFNGELYNDPELREELREEGAVFRSDSDTETFLEWLAARGPDGLERVNGFFAFALWDRQEKSILIGRDRYGIKPLFYREEEAALLFASELEALTAFGIPKAIERRALQCYLQLTYVPAPLTMMEGVRKCLPGEWLKFSQEGKEQGRLDQGGDEKPWEGSFEQAVEACRDLLDSAVHARLRSDVPLGVFLSGGIDSGIITALAAKHQKGLPSFSIGYDDPVYDESREAAATASFLGTEHRSFLVDEEGFCKGVEAVLEGMDEPFADSSAIPVQLLSKWTRDHVKVVLSGDGADELFGGYNKHRAEHMARNPGWRERMAIWGKPLWKRLPKGKGGGMKEGLRKLDRFAEGASLAPEERYWRWASLIAPERAARLMKAPLSDPEMEEERSFLFPNDPFHRMEDLLRTDRSFVLPNDMLKKLDRMSMASGLEARVPFLDHRFLRFVESLPAEWRIDGKERKLLLKRAFSDLLPQGSMERPKHGFEVPLADLLRKTYDREIGDHTRKSFLEEQNIFSPDAVQNEVRAFRKGRSKDNGMGVWSLLVFQKWWGRHFS
ncbi:MAG: asparagine synthase (glutamine-hydrolyzing) [Flavobacteriales bacterium]